MSVSVALRTQRNQVVGLTVTLLALRFGRVAPSRVGQTDGIIFGTFVVAGEVEDVCGVADVHAKRRDGRIGIRSTDRSGSEQQKARDQSAGQPIHGSSGHHRWCILSS